MGIRRQQIQTDAWGGILIIIITIVSNNVRYMVFDFFVIIYS